MTDATAVQEAFIITMALFAIAGGISSLLQARKNRPLTRISPRQDDADTLLERIWQCNISRNRKAHVAYVKMAEWHRNLRSEGRGGEVVPIRGRR